MLRGVVCESTSSEECGKNTTLHSREDLSKSQISFEESSSSGAAGGDGCLYPDNVIMDDGVSFQVRYTGCLEVKTSMKSLDFQTRTQVARESINRVCEAAGLKCAGKRRIDKRILQYISDRPCLQNAGTNVIINDTLDFLAYIAKNEDDWRACYVLECGGGQSEDLIVTIGKAFMLRYNALNKNTSPYPNKNYNIGNANDKDYYNDLPNKLPPDLLCENNLPHKVTQLHIKKPRNRLSSNLIDLNSPPPDQIAKMNLSSFETLKEEQSSPAVRDVFDIQPFSLSAEVQRSQLMTESWFHGGISRPTSESLLCYDGDFLVRESQGKHGQYVLTGLEGKTPKHLLLIDPEGIVRTKDRIFDSISHLINYHWYNTLPIISEETELVLKNPVLKKFIVKED
ncbi:SHC-transforming protein 4 isoform X2 [Episyrphus balteatus]|uniref:SHC-transforming protein 4 isoform X2 n=1 Tax=Episyrphus balteatus TaxID=286459 RepID=UPI00248550C7|nr:SHC-transforming protein 4 isoform X2 [Episyrphus balteatus]